MHALDIITLVVFFAALVICVWKGFLKILLKLGALVIAATPRSSASAAGLELRFVAHLQQFEQRQRCGGRRLPLPGTPDPLRLYRTGTRLDGDRL